MDDLGGRRGNFLQWLLGGAGSLLILISTLLWASQEKRVTTLEDSVRRNTLYKEEVSDHNADIHEIKELLEENRKDTREVYRLLVQHDRRIR